MIDSKHTGLRTGEYKMADEHEAETFGDIQSLGDVDPHGMEAGQPGAKLDGHKPMPSDILGGFATALQQITLVGTFGQEKYSLHGWKKVPDGYRRYENAFFRHYLAMKTGETTDPESGLLHLAHMSWNVLAMLERYFDEVDDDSV
jgi:hypothetical protein